MWATLEKLLSFVFAEIVFVRAYVDETGSVTRAEVIKGIGLGCDEAALDAVLNTKFNPGKQRGKPIKVQVVIPISFKQ